MKHLKIILLALTSVQCSSSSNSKDICLSEHDTHQLSSNMNSINHKWTSFIDSLTSNPGNGFASSSDMIDDIYTRLQQIKDMSSRKPCEDSDKSAPMDHATDAMNTIQSHFDVLMHPTDAGKYSTDTGGYKYQGGAASVYDNNSKHTAAIETSYPNYGYNQGYNGYGGDYAGGNGYGGNTYNYPYYEYPQNSPYGEYSGNDRPNRNPQPQPQPQPQQPSYAQPQQIQSANTPPALNDKDGNFILRFTEKVIETVLYQLEVVGGVFSSQRNSKSLSMVSELENSVKRFSNKYVK